jgi:hypothetical protein
MLKHFEEKLTAKMTIFPKKKKCWHPERYIQPDLFS